MKAEFFGSFRTDFECLGDLSSINTVEKMAIVNEKSRTNSSLRAKAHEHHVEREYLHVLDSFASRALDVELENWSVFRLYYSKTASRFVKLTGSFLERENRIVQQLLLLTKILAQSQEKPAALDFQFSLCPFQLLGGRVSLAKSFDFSLTTVQFALHPRKLLEGAVGSEQPHDLRSPLVELALSLVTLFDAPSRGGDFSAQIIFPILHDGIVKRPNIVKTPNDNSRECDTYFRIQRIQVGNWWRRFSL